MDMSGEERRGSHGIFSAVCSAWVGSLGQQQSCCQRKTRKVKEGETGRGGWGGVMGNRGGELNRGWIVQRNGEKTLFLSQENDHPLSHLVKYKTNPHGTASGTFHSCILYFKT